MGLTEEARKTVYITGPPPFAVVVAVSVASRWEPVKPWFTTVIVSATPSTVAEILDHCCGPIRPAQPSRRWLATPGVATKIPGHLTVSTAVIMFALSTAYLRFANLCAVCWPPRVWSLSGKR